MNPDVVLSNDHKMAVLPHERRGQPWRAPENTGFAARIDPVTPRVR